jgi:LmbE family N-acetylglucosaminyl deacetylase
MKWLFIFAHPDDETVSCGGTIKKLAELGHEVILVSATDGSAGEVMKPAQEKLLEFGSLGALRRYEFQQVADFLGAQKARILDFADGEITNQMVWSSLTLAMGEVIEEYQPDALVTFDHTGWYFHLDHVGVSIATTLAAHQASSKPALFFHTHMKVENVKWSYVFPDKLPLTHQVNVDDIKQEILHALDLHQSQGTDPVRNWINQRQPYCEFFQLVFADERGRQLLAELPFFEAVA